MAHRQGQLRMLGKYGPLHRLCKLPLRLQIAACRLVLLSYDVSTSALHVMSATLNRNIAARNQYTDAFIYSRLPLPCSLSTYLFQCILRIGPVWSSFTAITCTQCCSYFCIPAGLRGLLQMRVLVAAITVHNCQHKIHSASACRCFTHMLLFLLPYSKSTWSSCASNWFFAIKNGMHSYADHRIRHAQRISIQRLCMPAYALPFPSLHFRALVFLRCSPANFITAH